MAEIHPSSLLQGLLPAGAVAFETRDFTDLPALHPAEAPAVQNAVAKRRAEFAAGRACAHLALAALGCPPAPLLRGADRRPLWPPGIIGSITHTQGYCAAAVAWQRDILSIGIDAEIIGRVHDDMLRLICTPAERLRLTDLSPEARAEAATIAFSGKEAFYKCQSEAGGGLSSFQDVELHVQGSEFSIAPCRPCSLAAALNLPLRGQYINHNGLILTAMAFRAA